MTDTDLVTDADLFHHLRALRARNVQLAQQTPAERSAITKKSAETRRRQLEDEIDPRRELSDEERARRVTAKIRADMAKLGLQAVKARRERAAARRVAEAEAEAELNAILEAEAGVA